MAEAIKEKKTSRFKGNYHYANGKRKTSIARVRLYEKGNGQIIINDFPIEEYFFGTLIGNVKAPLKLAGYLKSFDISIKVIGGGVNSQSDACRSGIAKALTVFDPSLRATLKPVGFLSRDSRIKERKKCGLKRARRAPQFSKR